MSPLGRGSQCDPVCSAKDIRASQEAGQRCVAANATLQSARHCHIEANTLKNFSSKHPYNSQTQIQGPNPACDVESELYRERVMKAKWEHNGRAQGTAQG